MRAVVVALLCGLVLAGCGGDGDAAKDTPETALRRHIAYVDKGQWGRDWDDLHPIQQAIVTKDAYVRCSGKTNRTGSLTVTKVLETYQEEDALPGSPTRVQSTAITYEIEATSGDRKETGKRTSHYYLVEGKWRWALSDPEAYTAGRCPA